SLTSAISSATRRASLALAIIGSGVPFGANTASQLEAIRSGTVSAMVGRSGTLGRRRAAPMASGTRLPDWNAGINPVKPSIMIGMRPAWTSVIAWAELALYGTICSLMPVRLAGQMREAADAGIRHRRARRDFFLPDRSTPAGS